MRNRIPRVKKGFLKYEQYMSYGNKITEYYVNGKLVSLEEYEESVNTE